MVTKNHHKNPCSLQGSRLDIPKIFSLTTSLQTPLLSFFSELCTHSCPSLPPQKIPSGSSPGETALCKQSPAGFQQTSLNPFPSPKSLILFSLSRLPLAFGIPSQGNKPRVPVWGSCDPRTGPTFHQCTNGICQEAF